MIQYPIRFHARTHATDGLAAGWEVEASSHPGRCAVPPEFEGPGGAPSPEDYFALALMNCFVATFKVYAAHSKVTYASVDVSAELVVDKDEQRRPVMASIDLKIAITGASSPERARLLADKALASGFILNSVKTRVVPSVTVS